PGVLGGGAMRQLKNAASDVRITFVLAPVGDIDRAIDRSYDALAGIDRVVASFNPDDVIIDEVAPGQAIVTEDQAPVVHAFQRILTQAVRERASDIHIEPQDTSVRVRFGVDGALHDATRLPATMAQ